jgi:hypothetical protein
MNVYSKELDNVWAKLSLAETKNLKTAAEAEALYSVVDFLSRKKVALRWIGLCLNASEMKRIVKLLERDGDATKAAMGKWDKLSFAALKKAKTLEAKVAVCADTNINYPAYYAAIAELSRTVTAKISHKSLTIPETALIYGLVEKLYGNCDNIILSIPDKLEPFVLKTARKLEDIQLILEHVSCFSRVFDPLFERRNDLVLRRIRRAKTATKANELFLQWKDYSKLADAAKNRCHTLVLQEIPLITKLEEAKALFSLVDKGDAKALESLFIAWIKVCPNGLEAKNIFGLACSYLHPNVQMEVLKVWVDKCQNFSELYPTLRYVSEGSEEEADIIKKMYDFILKE